MSLNLQMLKKYIDNHTVISFDVFDTALLRPVCYPEDMFRSIEESFNLKGFYKNRIIAEKKARMQLRREVNIHDIYKQDTMSSYSLNLELENELANIYANEIILELYRYGIKKKKRIIFISDTYYSSTDIDRLLRKSGYNGEHYIFSSCDLNLTKRNKDIFRYVINKLDVAPELILHMGDNIQSDYMIPKMFNIFACHLLSPVDMYCLERDLTCFHNKCSLNSNIVLKKIIDYSYYLSAKGSFSDYWERFGFQWGGPLVLSFLEWIHLSITHSRYSNENFEGVIFVARDGYLLKKAYDMLYTDGKISTYYVYAPRIMNSLINIAKDRNIEFKEDDVIRYIRQINKTLKLDLKETKESLIAVANDISQEYEKYINSLNIHSKRIAIVDSAVTHFSSQRLLSRFLSCELIGLYWKVPNAGRLLYDSYIYKTFQESGDEEILRWNLIEFILSSPENPILGVKDGKALYKIDDVYDEKRRSIFKKISKGIIQYIESYSISEDKHILTNKEATNYVNFFCEHPSFEDIKHFNTLKIASGIDNGILYDLNLFTTKSERGQKRKFVDFVRKIVTSNPQIYKIYYYIRTLIKGKY